MQDVEDLNNETTKNKSEPTHNEKQTNFEERY